MRPGGDSRRWGDDRIAIEQLLLGVDTVLSGGSLLPDISTIGEHLAGLYIVVEVERQHFVAQVPHYPVVFDGKEHFNPAIKVARHQIGATRENQFLAAVVEVIEPAVFQEAADDANDADVLAHSRDAWAQAAGSANQEINPHACYRSFVEQTNHSGVGQRIHFKNHVTVCRLCLVLDFALDQFFEAAAQIDWRHQEFSIVLLC